MQVTLRASTGVWIDVWHEHCLFCARGHDQLGEPQTCLAVDLFEVIAELAQLDLEDETQAAEAMSIAERAERRLTGRSS